MPYVSEEQLQEIDTRLEGIRQDAAQLMADFVTVNVTIIAALFDLGTLRRMLESAEPAVLERLDRTIEDLRAVVK